MPTGQDEDGDKTMYMPSHTRMHAAYTWHGSATDSSGAHRHAHPTQEQRVVYLCKRADGVAVQAQRNVSRLGRGLRVHVDLRHRALLRMAYESVPGGLPDSIAGLAEIKLL